MGNMDNLKKTIDEGLNLAREGIAFVAERAEDASRVAAIRIKIFAIQRRIERYYAELGQLAYEAAGAKRDLWADAAAKKAVKEIASLQAQVNDLFAQLQTYSHSPRRPAANRAPGTNAKGNAAPRAPRRRKPAAK